MSPRSTGTSRGAALLLLLPHLYLSSCGPDEREEVPARTRTTLNELLLRDARTCSSGFTYPQVLIDGLGHQLVEELRCLDDTWLVFYEPCREPGCVWAEGPQPLAMRPEVLAALEEAARSAADFISITAAYRDVAMQYYSRWYHENCDTGFDAAVPGTSNHQGGRALDVRYYDFWWDILLDHGFEHPIPTDAPHFELVGDAEFRAESEELKQLSVLAFQRLWNRNHPEDRIAEDGVYGDSTKERLGNSPVEGFEIGACTPGSGGGDADAGSPGDAGSDAEDAMEVGSDAGDRDSGPDGTEDSLGADSGDPGEDGGDDAVMDARDLDSGDDTNRPDVAGGEAGDAGGDGSNSGDGVVDATRAALPLYRAMPADSHVATEPGCGVAPARHTGSASGELAVGVLALAFRRRRRDA